MEVKGLMAPSTMEGIEDRVESLKETALEEFWVEDGDYGMLDFNYANTMVELTKLRGTMDNLIRDVTNAYVEIGRAAKQDGF